MRLSTKDIVGALLVTGTLGVLATHVLGPEGHQARHPEPMADAGGAVTRPLPAPSLAFVDVNVVPMDRDGVLRNQVVVVEGGFVRAMGAVGDVAPPPGARIVDGEGRYLLPGLTDAHVHLPDDAEAWLPLFLANGVTTVFNLRGEERHLALRDRIRAGEVVGPTVYTSGPFTNEPRVRSPEEADAAVREQARRGYDFVKLHGDLSEEAFRRLVAAGRSEGIAVVGHAPRNLPFSAVLETGQVGIVHAEELIYTHFVSLDTGAIDDVASAMAEAGTWLTPTLSTFRNITTQWGTREGLEVGLASAEALHLPESVRSAWSDDNPYITRDPRRRSRIQDMYDFQVPLVRTLHRAGIPMLTGTDTPLPVMAPGFSLHDELDALEDAGLRPYEALAAATRNAGRFVAEHVDETARFGTVSAGARADLVLAGSDPLEDLATLRRPEGVMVRGRWFDRAQLDRMLEEVGQRR